MDNNVNDIESKDVSFKEKIVFYFRKDANHVNHIYSISALLFFLILSSVILFFYLGEIEKKKAQDKKIAEFYKRNEIEKTKLALKLKKQKDLINSLNIDNSLQKFVNSKVSFNDKSYIPENLVGFKNTHIIDAKGNGKLREEAMNALIDMNKAFYKEFNKNITVVSSYRSYAYQKGIKDRGCPDNLCSKAGYSEHQSGLAVDLWEASTKTQFLSNKKLLKYFNWLNDNAYKYGFHNTYQKGLEIDGYDIEPWHWRYIGVELATYLKDNNITIAEFYNKNH